MLKTVTSLAIIGGVTYNVVTYLNSLTTSHEKTAQVIECFEGLQQSELCVDPSKPLTCNYDSRHSKCGSFQEQVSKALTEEANEILNKILECIHMQRKEPEYKDNWFSSRKLKQISLICNLKTSFKKPLKCLYYA